MEPTLRRLSPDHLQAQSQARVLGASSPATGAESLQVNSAPSAQEQLAAERAAIFAEARERGASEGLVEAEREIARRVEAIAAVMKAEHAQALKTLQRAEQALTTLTASLADALAGHARESEEVAVEVAYAGLVRLLGERAEDHSLIATHCRAVVREFGHASATLRVNEADRARLEPKILGVPVEVDRRLAPGQCVIDSVRGQVESGLDVRLEALRQSLLASLAAHRSTP